MQGCVRPVLQPRRSPQFSQPVFPLLCSRNIWTPRQERKRKGGRKRNVYLTRLISPFPSFAVMEKGRGAVQRMSVGTKGTWTCPGISLACHCGAPARDLLSVTQLFPQNAARSHEACCGRPVAAPRLCGQAPWAAICTPRYYQCMHSRVRHGQKKINVGSSQPRLS